MSGNEQKGTKAKAKISAELEREFMDVMGFAIEELYGMTETGTSTINPTAAHNRIGSIGHWRRDIRTRRRTAIYHAA